MRIAQLEIQSFRGIREGKITLPAHGVLFGPNNVGKSSIVDALALLLGRERLLRPVTDWDFHGGDPKPESRFTIIATITDFAEKETDDEPESFPDWFLGEDAGRPVWWSASSATVCAAVERPAGARLAIQLAASTRFDEEECEFLTKRFFYNGPCDPFTDEHCQVPAPCLQQLGVFILPGSRQWEKLLGMGASTFRKVLKEAGAVPGTAVDDLKRELRVPQAKLESVPEFEAVLHTAAEELRGFLMLDQGGSLAYRVTSLDTLDILQNLLPHVAHENGTLLPFARHGSGMVSLQAFLVLLAFAQKRKAAGKNFILIAEEPELHLHPSLHARLVNRIRSLSTQSLVTTHSPLVAATYQPGDARFLNNSNGKLSAEPLLVGPIGPTAKNAVKKLYLQRREAFYDALMGGAILVPEGDFDYDWLRLWQRVAEASADVAKKLALSPLTIVPTCDASVVATYGELRRFRPDAVPLVDGDQEGERYVAELKALPAPPRRIARWGTGAIVETASAWILEPCLLAPGPALAALFPDPESRTRKMLQDRLGKSEKKNRALHEELAWEALECEESVLRAGQLIADLGAIASGSKVAAPGWTAEAFPGGELFTAGHIQKA